MNFSTFVVQLNDAILAENGPNLAFLLRRTSPHGKELANELRYPNPAMMNKFEGCMQSPWDEIAIQYVLTCTHIVKDRKKEAFRAHSQMLSPFLRFFGENRGWTLPVLFTLLRDSKDLAMASDEEAGDDKQSDMQQATQQNIVKAFSLCLTDRTSPPEESRKWGAYWVVGLILKCYFRLRRISLSKNILRALEVNDIPPLSAYPRSHQVTYRFYLGMLSFLNEEFVKAEQELTLAFYHCYTKAKSNQQRILRYLIPLRILRGHLPSKELLRRFPALDNLFTPFISAIRLGDISAYDRALETMEAELLGRNMWFTLEKARELCLRGLFRRMWVAADKSTRLPISMFSSSLRVSGSDVQDEEAECLVANMIYKGFIRGYISHEKQMVVLAQTNAFPRVADRASPYALM